jgi:glucose/arabinose dehydrogenase
MLYLKLILTLSMANPNQVRFEQVHEVLRFLEPVQVVFDGVHDNTMYVVEKSGIVRRVSTRADAAEKPVYLDIKERVADKNDEEGLLSLVFHPEFEKNGNLFVWYTAHRPRRGVLSKFTTTPESQEVDPASEVVLLEVDEPWGNHNGGTVLFGPDGFLYLGIGDGGAANDPQESGQNKKTLLGKIIRININKPEEDRPYSIPSDNPFVGVGNTREEIWATGMRNPWRMSFDRETGKLWAGDVGQHAWEEIDVVVKAGNYGWNVREGYHEFQGDQSGADQMIDPVFEYGRRSGGSITGGYVYRGPTISWLIGDYVYADYLSKRIWSLTRTEGDKPAYKANQIATTTPLSISSFGENPDGEILACGFQTPYASIGKIYRLVPVEEEDLSNSTTDIIR